MTSNSILGAFTPPHPVTLSPVGAAESSKTKSTPPPAFTEKIESMPSSTSKETSEWNLTLEKLIHYGILDANGDLNPIFLDESDDPRAPIFFKTMPKIMGTQINRLDALLRMPFNVVFNHTSLPPDTYPFAFQITLGQYLSYLQMAFANDPVFKTASIEFVGSTVLFILGWEYFHLALNKILQRYKEVIGFDLKIEDILSKKLIDSIKEELLTLPRDFDIRVMMPNATDEDRERLKKIQAEILLKLAQDFSDCNQYDLEIPSVETALDQRVGMFRNLMNVSEGKDQFLVLSLSDRNPLGEIKVDVNFVQSLLREYLFDRDGIGLPIQDYLLNPKKCTVHPKGKIQKGLPAFLDRLTRKIGIHDAETINSRGWGVLQSLLPKGYRAFNKNQQTKLLQTTIDKIPVEQVPAYSDKGIYFADLWYNNIRNHGSDIFIEGICSLYHYYDQIEGILTPQELESFEKLVLKHLAGINTLRASTQEKSYYVPVFSDLYEGLLHNKFTLKEAVETVQALWLAAMDSPSTAYAKAAHVSHSHDQVEIIVENPHNSKAFAIRFNQRIEKAIAFLASVNVKSKVVVSIIRKALFAGRRTNFQEPSRLKPILENLQLNNEGIEKNLLKMIKEGSPECKRLGYELLIALAGCTSRSSLKTELIKHLPEAILSIDKRDRAHILERVERLFVSGQTLTHASLFTQESKDKLMQATTLTSAKKAWVKCILRDKEPGYETLIPPMFAEAVSGMQIDEKTKFALKLYFERPFGERSELKDQIESVLSDEEKDLKLGSAENRGLYTLLHRVEGRYKKGPLWESLKAVLEKDGNENAHAQKVDCLIRLAKDNNNHYSHLILPLFLECCKQLSAVERAKLAMEIYFVHPLNEDVPLRRTLENTIAEQHSNILVYFEEANLLSRMVHILAERDLEHSPMSESLRVAFETQFSIMLGKFFENKDPESAILLFKLMTMEQIPTHLSLNEWNTYHQFLLNMLVSERHANTIQQWLLFTHYPRKFASSAKISLAKQAIEGCYSLGEFRNASGFVQMLKSNAGKIEEYAEISGLEAVLQPGVAERSRETSLELLPFLINRRGAPVPGLISHAYALARSFLGIGDFANWAALAKLILQHIDTDNPLYSELQTQLRGCWRDILDGPEVSVARNALSLFTRLELEEVDAWYSLFSKIRGLNDLDLLNEAWNILKGRLKVDNRFKDPNIYAELGLIVLTQLISYPENIFNILSDFKAIKTILKSRPDNAFKEYSERVFNVVDCVFMASPESVRGQGDLLLNYASQIQSEKVSANEYNRIYIALMHALTCSEERSDNLAALKLLLKFLVDNDVDVALAIDDLEAFKKVMISNASFENELEHQDVIYRILSCFIAFRKSHALINALSTAMTSYKGPLAHEILMQIIASQDEEADHCNIENIDQIVINALAFVTTESAEDIYRFIFGKRLEGMMPMPDLLTLRVRFIEEYMRNNGIIRAQELVQDLVQHLMSWIPNLQDQRLEEAVVLLAYDLIINLVNDFNAWDEFNDIILRLMGVLLTKPNKLNEKVVFFGFKKQLYADKSLQSTLSELIRQEQGQENTESRQFWVSIIVPAQFKTRKGACPDEDTFVKYFSHLMKKILRNESENPWSTAIFRDFAMENIWFFQKCFPEKRQQNFELLDHYMQTYVAFEGLMPTCVLQKQHILSDIITNEIIDKHPSKVFEWAVLAEYTKFEFPNLPVDIKAKILSGIIKKYLKTSNPTNKFLAFVRAARAMDQWQLNCLSRNHALRVDLYTRIMKFAAGIASEVRYIGDIQNILHDLMFIGKELRYFAGYIVGDPVSLSYCNKTITVYLDLMSEAYEKSKETLNEGPRELFLRSIYIAFAMAVGVEGFAADRIKGLQYCRKIEGMMLEYLTQHSARAGVHVIDMMRVICIPSLYPYDAEERAVHANNWIRCLHALKSPNAQLWAKLAFKTAHDINKVYETYDSRLQEIQNLLNGNAQKVRE